MLALHRDAKTKRSVSVEEAATTESKPISRVRRSGVGL